MFLLSIRFYFTHMDTYETIVRALGYIRDNAGRQPSLDDVATSVNMSPYHFQRLFTEWAGISPKKFLQYLTLRYAKNCLKENRSLFETAHQTGLSGTGRLHDLFVKLEGMTPGEYKNGGENLTIYVSVQSSPYGKFVVASTDRGICNLFFINEEEDATALLREEWPSAKLVEKEKMLHLNVAAFFKHEKTDAPIALRLKGTPFQLKVWQALLQIPEGALTSYGVIATHLDAPTAQRAVGTAVGKNPVGYLIPCHRVIKSMGETGGYRWNPVRKQIMIGREAAQTNQDSESQTTLF